MYDEPCMQWGAGASVLASWGGGARVRVVGNGRQECLATELERGII